MKPQFSEILDLLQGAQVYDLGVDLFAGMPRYPSHPPFLYGMTKRHGDLVNAVEGREISSAADAISTGTHIGTHIDGLGHFSCNGCLFQNIPVDGNQSYERGLERYGVETIAPIFRRGVLLDVAGLLGGRPLSPDFTIEPDHLTEACRVQGVDVRNGDVALIRTGWGQYWPDPIAFVTAGKGNVAVNPGPGEAAAKWLSGKGVFAAGADNLTFEKVPSALPAHVHLLVENGIHIIEVLNLEQLARDKAWEFLFIAQPLKIRGGTGSPVRPVAVVV